MQQCLKAYLEYQRSISINFTFHSIELYPSSCRANYTTYILHATSFLVYQRSIFSYNDARITIVSMHQENNQRGGKKKYKSGAQENTERMRLRILGIGRHCSARNAWNIHYSEISSSSISSAFVKPTLIYKLVSWHTVTFFIASEFVFPFFMWTTYLRLLPQLVLVYLEVGF